MPDFAWITFLLIQETLIRNQRPWIYSNKAGKPLEKIFWLQPHSTYSGTRDPFTIKKKNLVQLHRNYEPFNLEPVLLSTTHHIRSFTFKATQTKTLQIKCDKRGLHRSKDRSTSNLHFLMPDAWDLGPGPGPGGWNIESPGKAKRAQLEPAGCVLWLQVCREKEEGAYRRAGRREHRPGRAELRWQLSLNRKSGLEAAAAQLFPEERDLGVP